MSDTPCVDGCGQDAATIGRLRAEVEHLRENREAAIEGGMAAVAAVAAERDALRERLAEAEDAVERIEHLAIQWARDAGPGSRAADVFGPQKVSVEYAVREIRAALAPQDRPRTAVDAPEAPGQSGRGEDAADGESGTVSVTPDATDLLAALRQSIEDAKARRLGR